MKTKNVEEECALGLCPGVYELVSNEECIMGSCPGVYKLKLEECVLGSCPGVYQISPEEKCIIANCPGIFEGIEKDYLIIGSLIENPKDFGLEKKVGKGEALIRIPKSIIDNIKR